MKLDIINFKKASEELRLNVVNILFNHWEEKYIKNAQIYEENELKIFLDKQYKVFIFTESNNFIGTITISNDSLQSHTGYKTFWISNVYVIDTYRNKGIGSIILNYAEEYLKSKGIQYVALTAEGTGNNCTTRICNYYKKHGYKQIGFDQTSGYPIFMKSLT
jgi:GNAT superfamily N-acetyltransferase